jgi:hypothetical protein
VRVSGDQPPAAPGDSVTADVRCRRCGPWAWRGGSRQASLVRFLRMCDIEPMTEDLARQVGMLAGRSGHADIVDVAVVEAPSVAGTPS